LYLGISRDDNNVNAVDRASTVVKTEVTDEKTMTKTLRTETSMVITTVTVTEITTTSTTTVPLGPLPPYTTTTPTTPTGPTTTWKPPTNPCRVFIFFMWKYDPEQEKVQNQLNFWNVCI